MGQKYPILEKYTPLVKYIISPTEQDKKDAPMHARKEQETTPSRSMKGDSSGKVFQLYIGNLTWWTTDQDIQVNIILISFYDLSFSYVKQKLKNSKNDGYIHKIDHYSGKPLFNKFSV